uniref:Bromo domain-containing protein n=1 Tax=Dunaliella tertiolecta TaxID=3047 RepID=A0A7S3R8I7_DUNTE
MDGLAPVRSSKQDQIHNSIVSTLLALMDGLDARGKVVVIGATNRVDAIDGALRRPGRFDRELLFPLPNLQARRCILDIHTAKWAQPPSPSLRQELAAHCAGYCGADLKALCAEAALAALRRRYPQIYESDQRLVVDPASVRVERQDFFTAAASITPSSHRSAAAHAHPLTPVNAPCLGSHLSDLLASLCSTFPPAAACMAAAASQDDSALNPQNLHRPLLSSAAPVSPPLASSSLAAPAAGVGAAAHTAAPTSLLLPSRHAVKHCLLRPRLLLCGPEGSGAPALAAALLSAVEGLPVHSVGLPALLSDPGARSLEEALVHVVVEARRAAPAVLYLPHIQLWWTTAPPALRAVLIMLLEDLPPDTPLLLLATANTAAAELEPELLDLFNPVDGGQVVELTTPPPASARAAMLAPLLHEAALPPPPLPPPAPSSSGAHRDGQQQQQQQQQQGHEELPVDMAAVAARQEEEEARQALLMRQRYEADQAALRGLRMGLRDVTLRLLGDRRWRDFAAPVDPEEDPEYWQTVRCPCDLATILAHVDSRHYNTAAAYLAHVALIGKGWREYFEVDEQQQYHHQQQQQQQQRQPMGPLAQGLRTSFNRAQQDRAQITSAGLAGPTAHTHMPSNEAHTSQLHHPQPPACTPSQSLPHTHASSPPSPELQAQRSSLPLTSGIAHRRGHTPQSSSPMFHPQPSATPVAPAALAQHAPQHDAQQQSHSQQSWMAGVPAQGGVLHPQAPDSQKWTRDSEPSLLPLPPAALSQSARSGSLPGPARPRG